MGLRNCPRARWKQIATYQGVTETTIYIGGILEKVSRGSVTEYRHYIPAGAGSLAIHTRRSGGSPASSTYYVTRDHLGSSTAVMDASGASLVNLSFAAFGSRRCAAWHDWPLPGDYDQITATTRRGFTGHEHLDNLSLIHMNGRVQDPKLGRFISADPLYIGNLADPQSLNPYSYVGNRPLSEWDPDGLQSRRTLPALPDSSDPGFRDPTYRCAAVLDCYEDAMRAYDEVLGGIPILPTKRNLQSALVQAVLTPTLIYQICAKENAPACNLIKNPDAKPWKFEPEGETQPPSEPTEPTGKDKPPPSKPAAPTGGSANSGSGSTGSSTPRYPGIDGVRAPVVDPTTRWRDPNTTVTVEWVGPPPDGGGTKPGRDSDCLYCHSASDGPRNPGKRQSANIIRPGAYEEPRSAFKVNGEGRTLPGSSPETARGADNQMRESGSPGLETAPAGSDHTDP